MCGSGCTRENGNKMEESLCIIHRPCIDKMDCMAVWDGWKVSGVGGSLLNGMKTC